MINGSKKFIIAMGQKKILISLDPKFLFLSPTIFLYPFKSHFDSKNGIHFGKYTLGFTNRNNGNFGFYEPIA
jgi:hypothetical protein